MGDIVTCKCELQDPEPDNTLSKLTMKLENYANNNNIMQFNKKTREMLQRLFVLNQSHVGDRLISMAKQKSEDKDSIMSDLSKINLQQFDEICHASTIGTLKTNQTKNITPIQLDFLRVGHQYIQQGERCLSKMKFLLIITAMCFAHNNDPNPTAPTDLLSQKSKIQILLEKVEAFNVRYNCDAKVCVIYPKKMPIGTERWSDKNIEFVPFQPNQPCFSSESKIKFYGNKIQFNEYEGDLLHYLFNSTIKGPLTQYDYINFCDIGNYASPLINPAHLGYLNANTKTNILAAVKSVNDVKYSINNQFINKQKFEFGDILMKTTILNQLKKDSALYQILNMRIERKLMKGFDDCYFFCRLPQDILYADWTELTKVPYSASNRYEYSNFCKSILGIANESQTDIVEIAPSILYGDQSELVKIRNSLRGQAKQAGFPIMIMKSHSGQI